MHPSPVGVRWCGCPRGISVTGPGAIYRESEKPALFGPGEWHGTQEPLEGQRARLPTFGDGFHDIGCKEGKSQDTPYVSFTQVVFARDLGCVGILTLTKCLHPGSAARHRKDKRTVKTRGRFSPVARNNDFLAISGAPFQRHAEDQSRPVRPDGWCCGVMRPNNDFDLRCMNDDPFDMTADQVSRALIVWAAG